MCCNYRRFSIEPPQSSKTEEHISHEAVVTGSALNNASTEAEGEIILPPVAKVPQLADGHSAEQQEVIDYAWEVSNGDMRFIYLLTAENGEYSHRRMHPKVAGSTGTDFGLCGINNYYHSNIVSNPLFLDDWKWQMRKCYELYKNNVTFYGIIRYDKNPSYRAKIHAKFK